MLYGLVRADFGTSASIAPSAIKFTPGYEGGATLMFWPHKKIILDFRMRWVQQTFQWAPANGGTDSSLRNDYLIFDFGLGFPF